MYCSCAILRCSEIFRSSQAISYAPKRPRPADLRLNGLVYGGHEAYCFAQGDDDFLVVLEVSIAK